MKIQNNLKTRLYDGYFTVEASYIIPIAFLLIIVLLYFGFFCYEKSVSLQCCYLAALRGSNEWELAGKELEQYVNQTMEQLLEEKQLYKMEREYRVETGVMGVKVLMEEAINVPFAKVRDDDISGWEISNEKEAVRNKPSAYIRRYHMLQE